MQMKVIRRGKDTRRQPEAQWPDGYSLGDVKKRLQADLEQLTAKKASSLKFKVAVPPMMRFKAIMEMPIPKSSHGRPLEGETARVIKAEAFRRLTRDGSMRKMAKEFFMDRPESERYDHYRVIVKQHASKIKEFLSILKH
jgi:hypothetical protein